ncbi:MAG: TonB-dependent receptor [Gemmatimonadetes bacterium]|nr:TonB-dependent receptor [Gemmatimonadota bacterium]
MKKSENESRTPGSVWFREVAALVGIMGTLLLTAPGLSGQNTGTISGRILDAVSGAPVDAAWVHIAELSLATTSRPNGSFTLNNVRVGLYEVEVVRLGFTTETQQVTVTAGGVATLEFLVSRDALRLNEIVVTGTAGGTRARSIGNVVGRVQAAEIIEMTAVATLQDLLGARESGLSFNRNSGNIGTGSEMRIRGVSSVTMGSQPLIYVDGIRVDNQTGGGPNLRDGGQVSSLDDFSPDEIESIEIIKGPAAATLYGTEASAGVIQIITKKGVSGATQFNFSVRTGQTWLNDVSGKVGESFGRDADGNIISFNIYEVEKAAGRNHFQTGLLQSYTLSMRGGTDRLRYYLSADYGDDEGIVSYNWKKQTNLRSNLTILPSDQFTVNVSLGYITGRTSFMQQRTAWGMWEQFQWANPEGQDRILRGFLRARPEEIADNRAIRDLNRFTGSVTVTHVPMPWFTHRVIIGTDVVNEENSQLFPRRAVPQEFGALALGNLEIDRPRRQYNTLDYAASATYGGLPGLGDNVQFTSSFGFQYYARTEEIVSGTGQVFPAPQITTLSGAASTSAGQSFVENKSVGLYVQQELGWNDRLFLTAAVRGDDNSAFGSDYDAAIYPKFSGTWVLSEEDFWGGIDNLVSSFRLRSAWGKAGRQPDIFAGVTLYAPEPGPGGQPSVTPDVLGNPDLGPEVSSEIEVGFDAAFFDERISAEFTYYNQKVTDALINIPVPPTFGFPGAQTVNLGKLTNWGWELSLNGRLLDRSNFAWDLGLGVTNNQNRIDDLGGNPETNTLREGVNYPFQTERIILSAELDANGNAINVMCDGGTGPLGLDPGGAPEPCNGAPLLRQGNGLAIPRYEATVNTTFTLFDNLRLYAMAEWRGEHWRNLTDAACRHTCFQTSEASVRRDDPFMIAAITGRAQQTRLTSDFNASFAKLREISLNYTLPASLAAKVGASRASINVAARNLWTIWQAQYTIGDATTPSGETYPGVPITDPEARRAGSLTASNSNVPPLSNFTVTMRFTF